MVYNIDFVAWLKKDRPEVKISYCQVCLRDVHPFGIDPNSCPYCGTKLKFLSVGIAAIK